VSRKYIFVSFSRQLNYIKNVFFCQEKVVHLFCLKTDKLKRYKGEKSRSKIKVKIGFFALDLTGIFNTQSRVVKVERAAYYLDNSDGDMTTMVKGDKGAVFSFIALIMLGF
jgi:hypothetical protein